MPGASAINDVKATYLRGSAGLMRWLAVLSALAMAGCAALERQQTTLEALGGEVRDLARDMDAVGQSTQELADRLLAMEQAIDGRLDGIDEQLAKPISLPVPVCTMPEVLAADAEAEREQEAAARREAEAELERLRERMRRSGE